MKYEEINTDFKIVDKNLTKSNNSSFGKICQPLFESF
jgi:hypothetical protein